MNTVNKLKRKQRKRILSPEQQEFRAKRDAANKLIQKHAKTKGAKETDFIPSGVFGGDCR